MDEERLPERAEERGPARPGFREALRFWTKLGFISFGGPSGQIAIMHTELVDRRKWIDESRFLHALNYCMLLPGPEAQQLATYIGWLLHGTWGGIAAGVLFVLPATLLLWLLSAVYVMHGSVPWVAAVFYGLKPAVVAIVAFAVLRIGKKALKTPPMWVLAGVAFVAIFFLNAPFPLIIVSAALIGFIGARVGGSGFAAPLTHGSASEGEEQEPSPPARWNLRSELGRILRVLAVALVLWWTPVLLMGWWRGFDDVFFREGVFFSKAAMVTFGGAYAVLPYVAQQAVEHLGWLAPVQMLDGLGLAETTPGPLIMVVEFVGFVGAWNKGTGLDPLLAGTIGALITVWVTFVPCFLWIFLGAPFIERLRGSAVLSTALTAVTAAVVGVVLNLAVWFAWHVFLPEGGGADYYALLASAVAFVGLYKWNWNVVPLVLGSGAAGMLYRLAF